MSLMTFIKSLLSAIFGGSKKTEQSTNTVNKYEKPYVYMSESVKGFVLSGHSLAERQEITAQIEEAEAKKLPEYQIDFDNGYYIIREGQIVGCAKYAPKEPSGKMSQAVRSFVLAGHSLEERAKIEEQINAAEAAGKTEYTIDFSNGYYKIKDGQIVGGAKGAKA